MFFSGAIFHLGGAPFCEFPSSKHLGPSKPTMATAGVFTMDNKAS